MSWTLIARYLPHILIGLVLAAILGVVGHAVWTWGYDTRDASAQKEARERAEAQVVQALEYADAVDAAARESSRRVEAVAEAGLAYERGKEDAQKASAAVVAGLLGDKRRLHHEIAALATERLSRDSATAGELGTEAQRGAARLGAVVRVVAEQDAQIRGLQEAYEALRRPAP